MTLFFSKVGSSCFEIILFCVIPLIWWFVTARKQESFFSWMGLKKVCKENQNSTMKWSIFISIAFVICSVFILYNIKGTTLATSDFNGKGMIALPAALVYAFFNTAFPEELLFRGFLLKRLQTKMGFAVSNIVQSILFGLLHGAMFFSLVAIYKAVMIVLLTSTIAWFMGYINEKKANGSILPSWMIHGGANVISSLIAMFSLL